MFISFLIVNLSKFGLERWLEIYLPTPIPTDSRSIFATLF